MSHETNDRLQRLENQVRLLTRVALSLALLVCLTLAAFAWQPQDKVASGQQHGPIGRYQLHATDKDGLFAIDTWTGECKPIWHAQGLHLFKTWEKIKR